MAAKKRARRKVAKKKAAKKTAPTPMAKPVKWLGDPVMDWLASAAADNALDPDTMQRYINRQITYEEAERMWRDAHRDQNVWSDLDGE